MRCFWVTHALFDLLTVAIERDYLTWPIPGQNYQYAKWAIGAFTSLSFSNFLYPFTKPKFLGSS